MTDVIADMLTRIRNALSAKHETVEIPAGGHKFNNVPSSTTAATCAAEGSATYKCSVHDNCGVEVTVKLSKVHHNLKIDTVDASCTNGG